MPNEMKYKLYFTGPEVEQALHNALNLKDALAELNIYGVTKLGDGTVQVDLNTVTEPGIYVVDKYTNGPSWSTSDATVTPIMLGVYQVVENGVTYTYQTIMGTGKSSTRIKESSTSYSEYADDTATIIVNGVAVTGTTEVSLYGVTNTSISAVDGSHFIMKSPGKNAANAKVRVNGTEYDIYTAAGTAIPAGAFGKNCYVEFYFGLNPNTSTGLVLYTAGIGSAVSGGDEEDPSTDPDISQMQQDVTAIKNSLAGIVNPGVVVNTASAGSPIVLVASTMTKEEADAVHALTLSDDSKSKIVGTDSTGKLVATDLTLEEANNIHALGIGSTGGGTSSTSLVLCTDLVEDTEVEVESIPTSFEPVEPGEP